MKRSVDGESHFFEANNIRHHYLRWGDAASPTIILLHGIRSYAKTWLKLALCLRDHFHIIALDLRGRGESEWSTEASYFVGDYVSDMEALVAHLKLTSLYLLGHSLGGQNALVYTAKFPDQVKALVVEDIGPGSSASGEGAARIVREFSNTPEDFDSWKSAFAFWRSIRPKISDESLRQRVEETLKEDSRGRIVWSYDFVGIKKARLAAAENTSKLPDLWPAVDALKCPTLFIRGENSDFLSRDTLAALRNRNPLVEVAEVAGATHYVHDDNFYEFYQYVREFFDKVPILEQKS